MNREKLLYWSSSKKIMNLYSIERSVYKDCILYTKTGLETVKKIILDVQYRYIHNMWRLGSFLSAYISPAVDKPPQCLICYIFKNVNTSIKHGLEYHPSTWEFKLKIYSPVCL